MFKSQNLSFEYAPHDSNPPPLTLKNINISIQTGEFVAILGHNGSGKSTLARHLNALLTPTEGTLWVNGLDTKDPASTWGIRQSTGMVFQNPDNQIVATIVEEDVAFGAENLGVPPEEIRRRVDDSLAKVGMLAYASHQPHQLSGGQKQRIAIAGVLAMRPSCIVFDEPTAMLDPSGRKEVLSAAANLNKEGITIILITHFMEEAAVANRVLVMEDGEIILDGTPREVFSQVDKMQALGLGVPQPTALAHKLRQAGFNISPTILTIDEFMQDETVKKILKGQANANN
ncbi:MAG: energy-coupling factor transporter ATPase [Defluviitaleaceae bacterium]|nr:energy-coupling factor transporter ATPase [Defluviitaleaceae bacterium]